MSTSLFQVSAQCGYLQMHQQWIKLYGILIETNTEHSPRYYILYIVFVICLYYLNRLYFVCNNGYQVHDSRTKTPCKMPQYAEINQELYNINGLVSLQDAIISDNGYKVPDPRVKTPFTNPEDMDEHKIRIAVLAASWRRACTAIRQLL